MLTVGAVVDPFARGCDPLARANRCGITNDRHNVTMPARFGPKDAKTVLSIVVGYPLDQTRQHFLGSRLRLRAHYI